MAEIIPGILAVVCSLVVLDAAFMLGYYKSRVQVLDEVISPIIEELRTMQTPHEVYDAFTKRFYATKPKGLFRYFNI